MSSNIVFFVYLSNMIRYNSIYNCPMIVFKEIMATDNYTLLRRNRLASKKDCYKVFCRIFDEADSKFNIIELHRGYLKQKVKAMQYYAKSLSKGKIWRTKARLAEAEAERMIDINPSAVKFEIICAELTKKMGLKVNSKEVTVSEYFSYLEVRA